MNGGKSNPLFIKSDLLAKEIYRITKDFPKNEMYGLTSQIRRSGLSVILNIIEGFARLGKKENKRFQIIAFGSLKETKYLLYFAKEQEYLDSNTYKEILSLTEEISKMLWKIIN